ncbi:MAG TPA: hypothetical protein VMU16_14450 [Candidatus Binataceae bacterium]|nr:hypothetical protein [Candidatus Binataceae bacterium]
MPTSYRRDRHSCIGVARPLVWESMEESGQERIPPVRVVELTTPEFIWEVVRGIGVTIGLLILWALEVVRNVWFKMLDFLNLKPAHKRASAFPPGEPPRRNAA